MADDVSMTEAVNQNRDRLVALMADLVETSTNLNYLPLSQRVTRVLTYVAGQFKDQDLSGT